jgi:hypothetical protein
MREMHPYLVEMERIAARRGIAIHSPLQGAVIGPFKVLAPSIGRYIDLIPDLDKTPQSYEEKKSVRSLFTDALTGVFERVKERLDLETLLDDPPATSASNESSVVQMATLGTHRILLTGDVGPQGLAEAAAYARTQSLFDIKPTIVQVPHHGSRRNVTPTVLNEWLGTFPAENRGRAIASVGKDKSDYPRRKVSNAFTRRGYRVFSTHDGWVSFRDEYDQRANVVTADVIPFSPDVEDE